MWLVDVNAEAAELAEERAKVLCDLRGFCVDRDLF